MALISDGSTKKSYCPLKTNRRVDNTNGVQPYQRVDSLARTPAEKQSGKRIKICDFPKNHKVKVFRVASSKHTDYVVTNDLKQSDVLVAQKACGLRWKIERLHREAKKLTRLKKCQCRLARIVWNHITCTFLVWVYLKRQASETGKPTFYQVKYGMLSEYRVNNLDHLL